MTRVVIVGGGPGGYEAASVAVQNGAEVTVIERDGIGGSAVLTDCVPSKALIAVSDVITEAGESGALGVTVDGMVAQPDRFSVAFAQVNARIVELAQQQSSDTLAKLVDAGVEVIAGTGRLVGPHTVSVAGRELTADAIVLATGARPRVLLGSRPDGERVLTWEQLYGLPELPTRMIVVGPGSPERSSHRPTGPWAAKWCWCPPRDRALPGEDADAAAVLERAFGRRGGSGPAAEPGRGDGGSTTTLRSS